MTDDGTTLAGWLERPVRERAGLRERSWSLARSSASSHHVWTSLAEPGTGATAHGPLAGVAISVKDNIDVRGLATTAGSPLLPPGPVEADAGTVAALRAAGAVVVGKTNMHELAFGITSDNATHGPVRLPADPRRSAGGSSGGSAASVALGVVPVALGTDTGGSVSIPAACCGVVGFRPTTGRWPVDGVVMLSTSRDTVGVHARTVADARRVDEVITHARPTDTGPSSVAGLRLGLPRSRHVDLDPEVARVVSAALADLEAAGARLVEVDVPDDLAAGAGAGITLVLFEFARLLRARLTVQGSALAAAPLADLAARVASPDVRALVETMAASPVPPSAYAEARASRWRLQRALAATFEVSGLDALVWPTMPVLPPLVGESVVSLGGREVQAHHAVTRSTDPGSVAGLPVVTVPAGRSATGLPVGLSVEGRAHGDDHLLRVAAAVEGALGTWSTPGRP